MKVTIKKGVYLYMQDGFVRKARAGDSIDVGDDEAARMISHGTAVPLSLREPEKPDTPIVTAEGTEKKDDYTKMKVGELRKLCEVGGAWGCDRWTRDECIGFLTTSEVPEDADSVPGGEGTEDIIV